MIYVCIMCNKMDTQFNIKKYNNKVVDYSIRLLINKNQQNC